MTLAGRTRLAPAYTVSLATWGLPIAVIGVVALPSVAIVAMMAVGISNALIDVAGFTLIQRTTPEREPDRRPRP